MRATSGMATESDSPVHASELDAALLIDRGAWSLYQRWLIVATALAIVLDGVDNQLLPNAIPTLIREWGLPRSDFTNALALGPFGMMLGGLLGGWLGDRRGRRPALLASITTFGAFTAALAVVDTISALALVRFLAGLGLGGAMPNAATLAAEYVPARHRALAVTLTIVSIPLGGALAGEVAARIIPSYGWRVLFLGGGLLSVLVAAVFWAWLPESPSFLARHRQRWPELVRILRRAGHSTADHVAFRARSSSARKSSSVAQLLSGDYARDTLALWTAFFFGLMTYYVVVLLLPAVMTAGDAGFSQPTASRALAMWNYGGVVAAIVGALAMRRLGSRVAMLLMGTGAVIATVALARMPLNPAHTTTVLLLIAIAGSCVNGVQTTMYAVAANIYPAEVRSTGVGTAVAIGRVGNVLAAYAGAAALDRSGVTAYFLLCATFMVIVCVALASIQRHVHASR